MTATDTTGEHDLVTTLARLADALEKQSESPPPELIGADGVAAMLGIGERTARRLDVEGRLPMPVKIGGSVRWRLSELRDWIDAGCPPRQKWESLKERA
jgi:predicted DNA-binding transcriptional regulator AlpA